MSEAEVEHLKQLIRAWRDARLEWHNCPVSDTARFMKTWNAYGAAEQALEAAAVAVSSSDRVTEKLSEPPDDWQGRVLAAVDKLDKPKEPK